MTRQHNLHEIQDQLTEWLIDVERLKELPAQQLHGIVEQLDAAGIHLMVCSSLVRTLHPQIELFAQRWRRHQTSEISTSNTGRILEQHTVRGRLGEVDMYFVEHGHSHEAMYRNSPFYEVQTQGTSVRWKAGASKPQKHYPIYDDLEQRGATDYLAIKIRLQAPFEAGFSFSTDAPKGFPDGFEELLTELNPLIGLVLSFGLERLSLSEILRAYIGKGPAKSVLGGQMRRGQISRVVSVIGFADLNGYRERVGGIDDDLQNRLLDHFFKQIYEAITPLGGEILKFIGETVLFVFPYDADHAGESCQAALQGAMNLLAAPQLKVEHHDLNFPIQAALHVGEVSSGNIGSEGRLDFTIMGHAVNLTARLHQLIKTLDERLILSKNFASMIDHPSTTLGSFELKGVDGLQEAFTPDD